MGEDFKIQTEGEYADFTIEQRLSQLPEFWALVSYLEAKGLGDAPDRGRDDPDCVGALVENDQLAVVLLLDDKPVVRGEARLAVPHLFRLLFLLSFWLLVWYALIYR